MLEVASKVAMLVVECSVIEFKCAMVVVQGSGTFPLGYLLNLTQHMVAYTLNKLIGFLKYFLSLSGGRLDRDADFDSLLDLIS